MPSDQAVEQEIASELIQVHEDAYGAGAKDIRVHLLEDTVFVVIDVELSTAERTLIEADHADAVKQTREAFQAAIGPTFRALVERATGRSVASFLSAMSMEPVYSVEVFRLEPATASA
jgi:uncharacterized protein YbcI